MFEIFIFCPKIQLWFPEKTRENVVVLDFLAVDNFDFTRKIDKKFLGEKLVKMNVQNYIIKIAVKNLVKSTLFGTFGIDPESGYLNLIISRVFVYALRN